MLQVAHTFVCTFSPFSLVRSGLSCGHLRMRVRYFTNFQQVIKTFTSLRQVALAGENKNK